MNKNLNWILKKKENLNLRKLPEVPDGKKGWRMRKKKKASSWQRGTGFLSLSGCDQRFDNFDADGCLGATLYVFGLSLGQHYAEI